jgi:hypothetical protein
MKPSAVCREKGNSINPETVENSCAVQQCRLGGHKLHPIIKGVVPQTLGTYNTLALFNFKVLFAAFLTEMCSDIL